MPARDRFLMLRLGASQRTAMFRHTSLAGVLGYRLDLAELVVAGHVSFRRRGSHAWLRTLSLPADPRLSEVAVRGRTGRAPDVVPAPEWERAFAAVVATGGVVIRRRGLRRVTDMDMAAVAGHRAAVLAALDGPPRSRMTATAVVRALERAGAASSLGPERPAALGDRPCPEPLALLEAVFRRIVTDAERLADGVVA